MRTIPLPLFRNYLFCLAFILASSAHADFILTRGSQSRCVILSQADATEAEKKAAEELASTLEAISGVKFEIQTAGNDVPKHSIIIGPGAAASKFFPDVPFEQLGPDELVMRTKGDKLLLAGGRPRGTLYAVCRFLQEQCGVRWWTPWATTIPQRKTIKVPELNVRYAPPFENRAPFWYPAFNKEWSYRNGSTDQNAHLTADVGGCIKYAKSMAHSFYHLVPPDKHFAEHPDWFSLINGKRTHEHAQLCLTNPKLRDFVVERVKEWLREVPDAKIVTVTQNDCNGWCECPDCKGLDDAEGSHAGTMLTFANYVAEKIEPEFPHVLVDTFAYTYTRTPPKTVKARHNVIVRLCSIECNFREPLGHPSNTAFADDIRHWSKICSHLYIWDYTTDFRNYVHPHPNWFSLGPNVRFFDQYGVKGVFEQGAYQGYGGEMAEMRAWVLAQLLWNPRKDDPALIKEFLNGYYGNEAGRLIYQYLELVHDASKGLFLGCYLRKEPPVHLRFSILGKAEQLWQEAEKSVANDPEKLARVRVSHLPVRYAFLKYWNSLRHDCWEQNQVWPLPDSRKTVADDFRKVCGGLPDKPWTHVEILNEQHLTVTDFLKEYGEDSQKHLGPPPPVRLKNPKPPADLTGVDWKQCFDLQENVASLAREGKWTEILPDETASDLRAVWMPGDHSEWAFRIPGTSLPTNALSGKWKVFAVVRVKKQEATTPAPDSLAFAAGVYDGKMKTYLADFKARLNVTSSDYHSYFIGEAEFNSDRDIYVSPLSHAAVKSVWVDRVYLVPAK